MPFLLDPRSYRLRKCASPNTSLPRVKFTFRKSCSSWQAAFFVTCKLGKLFVKAILVPLHEGKGRMLNCMLNDVFLVEVAVFVGQELGGSANLPFQVVDEILEEDN